MIQKLLGHADLSTTQVYTKVVDAQLGAAVLRLPLGLGAAEDPAGG